MEGPRDGQQTPDPKSTIGSAAAWASCGELVRGRNLDCKAVVFQGFLCLGSLSGGTQLELFYTAVLLSKFVWLTSCWRLCFGKPRVEPGGRERARQWVRGRERGRKRGTLLLTGVAWRKGTPFLAVYVSGDVCATAWAVCERLGSGFSLNITHLKWVFSSYSLFCGTNTVDSDKACSWCLRAHGPLKMRCRA